ncbi:hypothetical protein GCM10009759_03870 [Kitasatospora saccharophila]|uniref:DUF397 domain-containing protein n=1 Tax=Kitasatospora saccharophila TaxID=407973 RepID=A0ABN2W9K5_9ACTN
MTYYSDASTLPVAWMKAKGSNPNENCVECAGHAEVIVVRDSKDPNGPAHAHTKGQFDAFLAAVAGGTLVPVV